MAKSATKKTDHSHPSLLPRREHEKRKSHYDSKSQYDLELREVQRALLTIQQSLRKSQKKMIVLFEGVDAAGKGGVIRRLTQYLDPRGFRVHSIGKPNPVEAQEHYLERFFRLLPRPGELVVFDRSWYGRVLVERVEGYCEKPAWKRAYQEIEFFENMLIQDGMMIQKYLIDISYTEQERRFKERQKNPFKAWKLTDEDFRNRGKWGDYHKAFLDMLAKTSSAASPWEIVSGESKWYGRVAILNDFARHADRFLGGGLLE